MSETSSNDRYDDKRHPYEILAARDELYFDAKRSRLLSAFDRLASRTTHWAGSPTAFCFALLVVIGWLVSGPFFDFSETWQLVINTGTTIVTFLMVFLIQQSQNKDSVAVHLKLDELLNANRAASNRLIAIEDLDEQDLRRVAHFYMRLANRSTEREPAGPV